MKVTYRTLTLSQAVAAIKSYNTGIYGRSGRLNTDIDHEGLILFKVGLSQNREGLTSQIAWVGKDYGGSAHTIAQGELPSKIADAILQNFSAYVELVNRQKPLNQCIPSIIDIQTLYKPFQQTVQTPNRTLKNWLVWATKVWHFLNPDAFQIMDSRTKKFYQVSASADVVSQYMQLQTNAQTLHIKNQAWLQQMRLVDGGLAWSDLKLWDKVAYEI